MTYCRNKKPFKSAFTTRIRLLRTYSLFSTCVSTSLKKYFDTGILSLNTKMVLLICLFRMSFCYFIVTRGTFLSHTLHNLSVASTKLVWKWNGYTQTRPVRCALKLTCHINRRHFCFNIKSLAHDT